MTPARRARVIARIRKGRPIDQAVHETADALRDGGWTVDEDIVKRKGELRRCTRRAVKRGVDLVVVVGGDGAIGQVATRLTGTGVPLGVVPTGTGNLFAGNLGIPSDRRDAIRTILEGNAKPLDVGRVRVDGKRRAFTIACGIGYDAKVMDATPKPQKLRWGQLAYLANAVRRARDLRNVPHVLTIDGRRLEVNAAQVFIANLGRMLPMVEPRPPVDPQDGLLDVIVVKASGPLRGLLAGWEAMRQEDLGLSDGGHVYRARARTIRVRTDTPRLVEIDGSIVGRTPVEASIVAGGLCVIVPAP